MTLARTVLLRMSTDPFLSRRLPRLGFVRRAARRFMPGEHEEDALRAVAEEARRGALGTLTLLGENLTAPDEARSVADRYVALVEEVRRRGLPADLSVKPTQFGLDLDPELARREMLRVAGSAGEVRVWIDMESSAYVDPTLRLFRQLREERDNLGLCLQAYLRRTPDDLDALLPLAPAIRLVKGAYREPEEVAFPDKADTDAAYLRLGARLLEARGRGAVPPPVFGTHDAPLLRSLAAVAEAAGLGPEDWEAAMLYGIARPLQERLVAEGVRLRVLVSYGEHWFPWYMRRLAERPANVGFVLRHALGLAPA